MTGHDRVAGGSVRPGIVVFALLTVLVLVAYGHVMCHSFINYDDGRMITKRIDRYDGLTLENIKAIVLTDYPREEPLIVRDLSYCLNASLFGPLNPQGYLLGNLLLHILVSFLVYRLTLAFFPQRQLLAGMAAVFFALHPVHVESVAWISSRKDGLYSLFFLLGFLQYHRFHRRTGSWRLLLGLLFFGLALFSKAAAIAFFPVVLCYRVIVARQQAWQWREILFLLLVVVFTVVFVRWYGGVLQQFGVLSGHSALDRNWGVWLLMACEYLVFYLGQLVLPLRLAPFYDFPAPQLLWQHIPYLVSAMLVVTALVVLGIKQLRQGRQRFPFLLAFFVCALLPYLNLAQDVQIYVADRYLYLASVPFCVLLAWLAAGLMARPANHRHGWAARGVLLMVGLYCLLLGGRTALAVTTWENTATFWKNAYQVAPNRPDTHSGLMSQYLGFYEHNRQSPEAEAALAEAYRIGSAAMEQFCPQQRDCPKQLFYVTTLMGKLTWYLGQAKESDRYFDLTFQLNPDYFKGRYVYGILLLERLQFDRAREQFNYILKRAHPVLERPIVEDVRKRLLPMVTAWEQEINERR